MSLNQFIEFFRQEHREIRDLLLDLQGAFQEGRTSQARKLLERIASRTGPHFRYEEESLYPSLVDIFGEDYVEKLLGDHDRAIRGARRLVELASREELGAAEREEAVGLVRDTLPHVSDCEGLSIMVERLPEERVESILKSREEALRENLDLLTWSARVRSRPLPADS